MVLEESLLLRAREAAARVTAAQRQTDQAKTEYHRAVRQLHLAGASLREIAEALDLSHQRVHQIIDASGGTAGWKPRTRSGADLACTFCGAPKSSVAKLVAGPGIFICAGCVELAAEVIGVAEALPGASEHLVPVPSTSALSCSFCTRPATEVARLVAGPGVRICDQCIQFCVEVIAAQPD